jgi:cytochrome c-type biogenesis protein
MLLSFYSLGLGLPFFLTALGMDSFLSYFKSWRTYLGGVSFVSGGLLVLVGVMIYADSVTVVTGILDRNGIGWYIGQ